MSYRLFFLQGPALYIGTNHSAPDKISEEKMEDKRKIKWKITKSVVNIAEVVYYKVMRAVRVFNYYSYIYLVFPKSVIIGPQKTFKN